MSEFEFNRPQRRSHEVMTPLLILAGVVGIPLALGLARCSRDDPDHPPTVSADQNYPNNYYLAGAGYYHAPFHSWFPFAYNFYDSGRGWFRGGSWRPTAVEDASEFDQLPRGRSGVSGGTTGLVGAPRVTESRPTVEAVSRANAAAATHFSGITRGGFGSSARSGVS